MNYTEFQKQITDFIFIEDPLEAADVIFIPGNGYPQNAENAARLYHNGVAKSILPSGKFSVTLGHFAGVQEKQELYTGNYETEWEFMRDVLRKHGVPESAILKEDQATYTWDNAVRSRAVTDKSGLSIKNAILCCRNVHARRCLMYYQKAFPDTKIQICPSIIEGIQKENWMLTEQGVQAVTGEVQRILYQFSILMK